MGVGIASLRPRRLLKAVGHELDTSTCRLKTNYEAFRRGLASSYDLGPQTMRHRCSCSHIVYGLLHLLRDLTAYRDLRTMERTQK